jgi:integrase
MQKLNKARGDTPEFTLASLEAVRANGKQQVIWDVGTPASERGLCLIVSAKGAKAFYVRRKIQGRSERLRICRFDDAEDIKSIRKKAGKLKVALGDGQNHNEVKRTLREELTFKQVFDEFLREKRTRAGRPLASSTQKDYAALLKNQLAPLAQLKISKVNRDAVSRLKISSDAQTNRARALISSIWKYAVGRKYLDDKAVNPAPGIDLKPTSERERFLEPREMGLFLGAVERNPLRDFWLMLLLTGQRKSNVMSMAWEEIDLHEGIWRIAAEKTKNKTGHALPLVEEVLEILIERRKLLGVVDAQGAPVKGATPWVFPSEGSKSGHLETPFKQWQKVLKDAGLADVRIHDLRRTMGSWQARRGESLLLIGKTLGHKSQQATRIYSRLDLSPVRDAMGGAVGDMLACRGVGPKLKAVK